MGQLHAHLVVQTPINPVLSKAVVLRALPRAPKESIWPVRAPLHKTAVSVSIARPGRTRRIQVALRRAQHAVQTPISPVKPKRAACRALQHAPQASI